MIDKTISRRSCLAGCLSAAATLALPRSTFGQSSAQPYQLTFILAALRNINYQGYTEVFMHPVPRGVPILETTAAITDEINRARRHLKDCLSAS